MDLEFLKLVETVSQLDQESSVSESLWTSVTDKIKEYLLGEQTYGEDRPAEEEDFTEYRLKSLTGLKCLLSFLQILGKLPKATLNKSFVVWSLLLCGENISSNLWTTSESIETSTECLDILSSIHKCKSISDLLVSETGSQQIITSLLLVLRPKLLRDTWRKYPAAVHCYQWILLQIKCPYLSDYLNAVFPTALIIMDDHIPSRRLIGLACLTHIIQNVPRTELCSQGLDNVLFHTLNPLLLQREPELVIPIYTCMTTLLASVEQGYTRSVTHGEWSRLESTLLTLLRNMELEDRLILRLVYVKCLEPILKAMGPNLIQLSKKLLSVFQEYLHKQTPETRHYAILAFETYTYNSKERLQSNGQQVLFLLLRTLYDLTKEMNSCDICVKETYTEIRDSNISPSCSAEKCAHHRADLQVVVRSIIFVKNSVPSQFDLIRQDVHEKLNFNTLLRDIGKQLF